MTAAAPLPVVPAAATAAAEPSRFAAYAAAAGTPEPAGTVDRLLTLVERLLVPSLAAPRSVRSGRSRS